MTCFLKPAAVCLLAFVSVAGLAQRKSSPPPASAASATPIKLMVDATHAPEKILHAQMQIPVSPGPLALSYPKWIPGEHGPTGPIVDLTGVEFFGNGQRLIWRRNLREMFEFNLTIPAGVTTL